jgi:rhamnose transport system permease protein
VASLLKKRSFGRETSLGVILVFTIGITGFINPRFVTGDGTRDLLSATAIVALLAIGIAPIMIMRHIDLSIASTVGLSAWLVADSCAKNPSFTWLQCFLIGGLVGVCVGVINGLLVAGLRLPSLVVTLGTLYIVRGGVYVVSNSVDYNAQEMPPSLLSLGQKVFFGLLPFPFLLALLLMATVAWIMKYTKPGRDCYAIGSNPPAADLVGLKVFRRTFLAYIYGQELAVVAAAVIGGIGLLGGAGTAVGVVIGALLVQTIQGGLAALGVDAFWKAAINGLLLIVAIYADRVLASRSEKALLAQRIKERV